MNLILQGNNFHIFAIRYIKKRLLLSCATTFRISHLNVAYRLHQLNIVNWLHGGIWNGLCGRLIFCCWRWALLEHHQRRLRNVSAGITFSAGFSWGVLRSVICIASLRGALRNHSDLAKVMILIGTHHRLLHYLNAFLQLCRSTCRYHRLRILRASAYKCAWRVAATDSALLDICTDKIIDSACDLDLTSWMVALIRSQNLTATFLKWLTDEILLLLHLALK